LPPARATSRALNSSRSSRRPALQYRALPSDGHVVGGFPRTRGGHEGCLVVVIERPPGPPRLELSGEGEAPPPPLPSVDAVASVPPMDPPRFPSVDAPPRPPASLPLVEAAASAGAHLHHRRLA
jgi:hypothetical protein